MKDTSCQDCIFAIYDGDLQTGCKEDRINKLAENGATLEYVHDVESGRNHYIIRNRFCSFCVHPDSMGDIPRIKWRETIVDLTKVRVAMVIYAGSESTQEDVEKSLNSVLNQTELPYCIYITIDNEKIDRIGLGDRLRMTGGLIYWKVEKVKEAGWGFDRAVDYILFKTSAMYFTSCNAGYEFPADYIERIDTAINVDMKQIIVILPDENNNGLFTQHKLYDDVVKAMGTPFVEKIVALAKEHGQEEFILKELP